MHGRRSVFGGVLFATMAMSLVPFAGLSEPPKASIYPEPRPVVVMLASSAPEAIAKAETRVVRPRVRPAGLIAKADRVVVDPIVPRVILRPRLRPDLSKLAVAPTAKVKKTKQSLRGSVCGDPDIRGEPLAPIGNPGKGCGIAEPVEVTSIAGVGFSQPATIDCTTAKALKKWMAKGMQPAFGNRTIAKLHIYGSYACRGRNNVKGAKMSEHGRGKAVDIAGFIFTDGTEWTVRKNYNKSMRKAQKSACGIFGTTLGPGSDGYHEDHLHFDTAKQRGGAYCR